MTNRHTKNVAHHFPDICNSIDELINISAIKHGFNAFSPVSISPVSDPNNIILINI